MATIPNVLFVVLLLLLLLSVVALILLFYRFNALKHQVEDMEMNAAQEREKEKEMESRPAVRETKGDDITAAFLPMELFEVLGIRKNSGKAADSLLKTQKEFQTGILNLDIADFEEILRTLSAREVYEIINQSFSQSIPPILSAGGVISDFHESGGFTALLPRAADEGLDAAILVCEKVRRIEEKNELDKRYSIGLCFGEVMIGVAGERQRLTALTLSLQTGLSSFLQKRAPFYYARILASETYMDQIKDAGRRYNYRLLGQIYIKSMEKIERVYDVFDADAPEVRNQKRKTRMVFEKGLELFLARNFSEARSYFIEVLKTDRMDLAAREYVLRCDQYAAGNGSNAQLYLEEY